MENWENKTQVKKGNIGEDEIKKYLTSKGWIVYKPETEGAHAFDKLCVKDKQNIIIAEVKTKARMNKYNATGFNERNLQEYLYIHNKYNLEIFCFFVDEELKKIYGNKLSVLMKEYTASDKMVYPLTITTKQGYKITLFSLETMQEVCLLNDEICDNLKTYSTRSYDYEFKKEV